MVYFFMTFSIFKSMVFIYVCIRILDLKLENPYENRLKWQNWNEKNIYKKTKLLNEIKLRD